VNDEIYNLPKGWVRIRLDAFAEIILGQSPPSSTYNEDGNGLSFYQGKLEFGHMYPTPRKWCTSPKKIAEKGDVLISVRAPVGPTNICPERSCIGRGLAAIRGLAGVETHFILYLMRAHENLLSGIGTGTTFNAITGDKLKGIQVPLSPLPEQHRIIAKIEELFTRLDAGVEALKKIKAQLKRYRQSVLKHAFEGKLTAEWRQAHKHELEPSSILLECIREERKKDLKRKYKELPPLDTSNMPELPDGWVWTRLLDVSEVVTGKTPSKTKIEYYGRDFCFYKPADLNNGYYVRESEDGLSRQGIVKSRLLPSKSTLVTCIGATISKTGFIRKEGASNQQINAIIPENQLTPELIYFVCVSPQFQKSIIDNASSTTLPILNKSRFEILPIPLMSILEQKEIVSEIERRFSVADQIEKTVDQSLKQAERLRQSILKRAFEGKLVPQDPNDEPAEKLLERIKEERAKRLAEDHSRKKNRTRVTTKQTRLV